MIPQRTCNCCATLHWKRTERMSCVEQEHYMEHLLLTPLHASLALADSLQRAHGTLLPVPDIAYRAAAFAGALLPIIIDAMAPLSSVVDDNAADGDGYCAISFQVGVVQLRKYVSHRRPVEWRNAHISHVLASRVIDTIEGVMRCSSTQRTVRFSAARTTFFLMMSELDRAEPTASVLVAKPALLRQVLCVAIAMCRDTKPRRQMRGCWILATLALRASSQNAVPTMIDLGAAPVLLGCLAQDDTPTVQLLGCTCISMAVMDERLSTAQQCAIDVAFPRLLPLLLRPRPEMRRYSMNAAAWMLMRSPCHVTPDDAAAAVQHFVDAIAGEQGKESGKKQLRSGFQALTAIANTFGPTAALLDAFSSVIAVLRGADVRDHDVMSAIYSFLTTLMELSTRFTDRFAQPGGGLDFTLQSLASDDGACRTPWPYNAILAVTAFDDHLPTLLQLGAADELAHTRHARWANVDTIRKRLDAFVEAQHAA
jgi:hypothetical protein